MPAGLRMVQLNCAYDGGVSDPAALLDRYDTLTGLSEALVSAGVSMRVVQRFGSDATITRNGVPYRFICDGAAAAPSPSSAARVVIDAVCGQEPDVVHIHGLMFPGIVSALQSTRPARTGTRSKLARFGGGRCLVVYSARTRAALAGSRSAARGTGHRGDRSQHASRPSSA
jgi:hypothetical protein